MMGGGDPAFANDTWKDKLTHPWAKDAHDESSARKLAQRYAIRSQACMHISTSDTDETADSDDGMNYRMCVSPIHAYCCIHTLKPVITCDYCLSLLSLSLTPARYHEFREEKGEEYAPTQLMAHSAEWDTAKLPATIADAERAEVDLAKGVRNSHQKVCP